jgi:uncharacterized caspase-like protein
MAAEDHAIVVGISRYKSFEDLRGPDNDSRAMIEWLRDPDGGDVPDDQIQSITSARFPHEVRPVSEDVYDAFEKLMDLAEANNPQPAGRRLYIFMAGHGIGPTPRDASLLMANAAPRRWGHSVNGGAVADHFGRAAYFEEIVLLMDCCRDDLAVAQVNGLPWQAVAGGQPRWVFGFAACFARKAREKVIEGEVRGVFTVAVLEALRSGGMTSKTLEELVAARMAELTDPDEYQRPYFQPSPDEFTFGPAIVKPTLTIRLNEEVARARVSVGQGAAATPLEEKEMEGGESWPVELTRGLYEVWRPGLEDPLLVKLTVGNQNVEI